MPDLTVLCPITKRLIPKGICINCVHRGARIRINLIEKCVSCEYIKNPKLEPTDKQCKKCRNRVTGEEAPKYLIALCNYTQRKEAIYGRQKHGKAVNNKLHS